MTWGVGPIKGYEIDVRRVAKPEQTWRGVLLQLAYLEAGRDSDKVLRLLGHRGKRGIPIVYELMEAIEGRYLDLQREHEFTRPSREVGPDYMLIGAWWTAAMAVAADVRGELEEPYDPDLGRREFTLLVRGERVGRFLLERHDRYRTFWRLIEVPDCVERDRSGQLVVRDPQGLAPGPNDGAPAQTAPDAPASQSETQETPAGVVGPPSTALAASAFAPEVCVWRGDVTACWGCLGDVRPDDDVRYPEHDLHGVFHAACVPDSVSSCSDADPRAGEQGRPPARGEAWRHRMSCWDWAAKEPKVAKRINELCVGCREPIVKDSVYRGGGRGKRACEECVQGFLA